MIEIPDKAIREAAEQAGFWGVDLWWRDSIPKFRRFIELVLEMDDISTDRHWTEVNPIPE